MKRLKNPINVSESSENLLSEEQIKKREDILDKDKKHQDSIDKFTDEIVKAMGETKDFDE